MDAQMKKGVLEMCLLMQIAREETYGYQLMKAVSAAFDDVNESTVYTILRRLHAQGCTKTYKAGTVNGPQRKYYKITPEGDEYLSKAVADWRALCDAIESMGVAR